MALQCDYAVPRCAISQYDLLAHTCGPPAHKFTQDMDAFFTKSTRNHNTSSWRVCRGFHFICRQDAKKVADQSQKCAFCQATKKQMRGANKLQVMAEGNVFVKAGLHRAGQFSCKNCAREQRSAAAACVASADAEESDEANVGPAAPAANDSDETAVRSFFCFILYIVCHTIYGLSFVYRLTYYDVVWRLRTRLVLGARAAAGQVRGGRRGAARTAARSRGGPAAEARGGERRQPADDRSRRAGRRRGHAGPRHHAGGMGCAHRGPAMGSGGRAAGGARRRTQHGVLLGAARERRCRRAPATGATPRPARGGRPPAPGHTLPSAPPPCPPFPRPSVSTRTPPKTRRVRRIRSCSRRRRG
jgi:hypothetical protein